VLAVEKIEIRRPGKRRAGRQAASWLRAVRSAAGTSCA
jgi:hypothetical protein